MGKPGFQEGGTINTVTQNAAIILGLIPLVVNIAALIYLGLTRTQMALGALWAFGVAISVVVIMLPIVAVAACFVALANT